MRMSLKALVCAGACALVSFVSAADEDLSQYRDICKGLSFASASADAVRLESRTSSAGWTAEDEAYGVTIEEGRLTGDHVWTADTIHVVSNWVTVATDASLYVEPGTVVKFTEDTGIRVEDGGFLSLEGEEDDCIRLTTLEDERGQASIYVMPYGMYEDNGFVVTRKVDVGPWATLKAVDVHAIELAGMAYVYVTVSGTQDSPFSLDWRIVEGTAKYGTDFVGDTEGTLEWTSSDEGTKCFAIPLVVDTDQEPAEQLTIEFPSACGINYSRDASTVTIVDSKIVTLAASVADSPASPATRLETRASLGGRLACGTETLGSSDGATATAWDTTLADDGWTEKSDGGATVELLVRNASPVHVVEGRLAADTIWTNGAVYLVRNWVTVPADLTLKVEAGAIVKFTESTGIRVEAGGKLDVRDTAERKVVFTMAEDDSIGGDSDILAVTPKRQDVSIFIMDYGMFAENGNLEVRNLDVNRWGWVSVQDARVLEQTQRAFVPVTLSTDRATAFSLDWVAVDGSATCGADYTLASGTMSWTGAGEGTKFIEIPIVEDVLDENIETFSVRITAVRGVNLVRESAQVAIVDSDLKTAAASFAESASSPAARVDGRSTFGAFLAHGTEKVGSVSGETVRNWATAEESDGIHAVTDGAESRDVLTLNALGVDVEEGRLSGSTTWTNGTVHLLRNWVVVPAGMTLTVEGGAIVKFSEDTGIRIEDGGALTVLDSESHPVVFTSRAVDTVGCDTDQLADVPTGLGKTIDVMPSGAFTENGYLEMRHMSAGTFGTVSVSDARSIESTGCVYVPVTVSGTRDKTFALTWEAVDGSAKYGSDYTARSGTVRWTGTSEGTKFIEIPLVADSETEDPESFTVRIVSSSGMNVGRACGTVEIVDSSIVVTNADIAFADASAVRLDQRTTLGGRLVCGVETYGSSTGGVATVWDTAGFEEDGWKTVDDGVADPVEVLVLNDSLVRIEEGRLAADVTWSEHVVHVVRNWVVVPSGVTLTISEGAVVKFTEDTGIKVEDGGSVVAIGSEAKRVVLTHVADDGAGGNTDMIEDDPVELGDVIDVMPSGSFSENGYVETRWMTSSSYGTATPHDAIADESMGVARVPVTVTGSRNCLFSVNWVATDGTAAFGGDYKLARGTLSWSGTSEGTKYVEIPLVVDGVAEPLKRFTLHFESACGINHARETVTVQVTDSPVVATGASAASATGEAVRIDGRSSLGGRLAHGVESVGRADGGGASPWDTTNEPPDRWVTLEDGGVSVDVLVRNDASVTVEEGRLKADATWTADAVHLVRNWVTVPDGITLTVAAEAVVKFTEDTGILVEPGGTLVALGTKAKPSVLTPAEDDASGGDSDLREAELPELGRTVRVLSGGTFSETGGVETRHLVCDGFGSVALHAAQAYEDLGFAYVPVTVSGSRSEPFSVYWRTKDGTATFGGDFTQTSGRLDWTKASEGTKFIKVPLVCDGGGEANESFSVEVTGVAGMNVETASVQVEIVDNAMDGSFQYGSGAATGMVKVWEGADYELKWDEKTEVTMSTTWNETDTAASFARLRLISAAEQPVTNELKSIVAPATESYVFDATEHAAGTYRLVHEVCDVYGNVLSRQEAVLTILADASRFTAILSAETTNLSEVVWQDAAPEGDYYYYLPDATFILNNTEPTTLTFDTGFWIKTLKVVNKAGCPLVLDVQTLQGCIMSRFDFSEAEGGVVFNVDGHELASSAVAGAPSTMWLLRGTNLIEIAGNENISLSGLPSRGYTCSAQIVPDNGVRLVVTAPDSAKFGVIGVDLLDEKGSAGVGGGPVGMNVGLHPLDYGCWGRLPAVNGAHVTISNATFTVGEGVSGSSAPVNSSDPVYAQYHVNPSMRITGIPFAKYRVIAHFSAVDANARFCPLVVNGYTYYGSTRLGSAWFPTLSTWSSKAWGDSSASNLAFSPTEGVNALVTGVLTGSDVDITTESPYDSPNALAALAAVEIVKVGEIAEESPVQTMTTNAKGERILKLVTDGKVRDLTVAGEWTNHLEGVAVDSTAFNAIGGNGIPVWQSYVLDVDPYAAKPVGEQIRATITMNADGTPDVRCEPDVSDDPNRNPFVTYTTVGKPDLSTKADWAEVTEGNKSDMRFFRIRVEIAP